MLTANNSDVKIIGRSTLLVQLQPRLPEVDKEYVITLDEAIGCLFGIEFLKTNNCVLNLHEKNYTAVSLKFQSRKVFRFFAIAV